MTSAEKKQRFIERQKKLGRKQFGTWLTPATIARLREIRKATKKPTLGDVIEELAAQAGS